MSNLSYGEAQGRAVAARITAPPATQTALQATPATERADGMIAVVEADQTSWQFVLASTAGASSTVLVPSDSPSTGRWLALLTPANGVAAAAPATNAAAISALTTATDGQLVVDKATGFVWRYSSSSTATDATSSLVLAATGIGSGAWLRVATTVDLKLAVDHTTADAAALFTVPTGYKLRVARAYWEVTTSFTGGTTPAVGISSSNANYNTKGDLLGGASGDLTATLVSTGSPYKGGTLGTKFGSNGVVVLVATSTIRFDRIADNFAAGAGFVHVQVEIIS